MTQVLEQHRKVAEDKLFDLRLRQPICASEQLDTTTAIVEALEERLDVNLTAILESRYKLQVATWQQISTSVRRVADCSRPSFASRGQWLFHRAGERPQPRQAFVRQRQQAKRGGQSGRDVSSLFVAPLKLREQVGL